MCCGESLEEHTNNQTEKIVKRQLKTAFREIEIKPEQLPILIAYEPTWAIGTGVTCDPEEANRIAGEIKRIVKKTITSMEIRERDIKVLYGGSINPENISFFLSQENIDGTLVGGASLDIEKFEKMLEETKKEAEKKLKNSSMIKIFSSKNYTYTLFSKIINKIHYQWNISWFSCKKISKSLN